VLYVFFCCCPFDPIRADELVQEGLFGMGDVV